MTFILSFASEVQKPESMWHEALLRGYSESTLDALCRHPLTVSSQHLVGISRRPWWSVAVLDDGYVHFHLARHISSSGRGSELAALSLDARWRNVQGELGGLLGLNADFAILDKLLQRGGTTEENLPLKDSRASYRLLLKAIQLSWGRFLGG